MKKDDKHLLKLLEDAGVCCKDCGQKYGAYNVGCSTSWQGTCRVCGEEKCITDTRDYGYLLKGRLEIINRNKKKNKAQKKHKNG